MPCAVPYSYSIHCGTAQHQPWFPEPIPAQTAEAVTTTTQRHCHSFSQRVQAGFDQAETGMDSGTVLTTYPSPPVPPAHLEAQHGHLCCWDACAQGACCCCKGGLVGLQRTHDLHAHAAQQGTTQHGTARIVGPFRETGGGFFAQVRTTRTIASTCFPGAAPPCCNPLYALPTMHAPACRVGTVRPALP